MTFDNSREVLLSNHFDRIDARLLVKKARIYFSLVPPSSDIEWESDELYCTRWWEPRQSKVLSLDHPRLKVGLHLMFLMTLHLTHMDAVRYCNMPSHTKCADTLLLLVEVKLT